MKKILFTLVLSLAATSVAQVSDLEKFTLSFSHNTICDKLLPEFRKLVPDAQTIAMSSVWKDEDKKYVIDYGAYKVGFGVVDTEWKNDPTFYMKEFLSVDNERVVIVIIKQKLGLDACIFTRADMNEFTKVIARSR